MKRTTKKQMTTDERKNGVGEAKPLLAMFLKKQGMPFEFIQVPANVQGSAKEELNRLLRGGHIASVRKEFLPNGEDSFWAFCINEQHRVPSSPQLRPRGMDFPGMSHMGLNRPLSRSHPVSGCDKSNKRPSGAGSPVDAGSKAPGGHPSSTPTGFKFPRSSRPQPDMNTTLHRLLSFLAAILALCVGEAMANYADSPNIRVDTRGKNLVSLSVAPATGPAPAPAPEGPQPSPPPSSNTVPSGGIKQFFAWANYDDGTSEDVTSQAVWSIGSFVPAGSKIWRGLFTAGVTPEEKSVNVTAMFGAGITNRSGSTAAVILPGMTVRIEYSLQPVVFNSQWSLSAQAIVAGNSSPVGSGDIRWDMDADGAFDDKTGAVITQAYSSKRSHLVSVQVQSGTETATAAVMFTVGASPASAPAVNNVADAFSEMLLSPTGDVIPNLPAGSSKLAVVIHGMENNGRNDWVKNLCSAIEARVPSPKSVVAYDWKQMADPSVFKNNIDIKASIFLDSVPVKPAGRTSGILLAERLKRERAFGSIGYSTAIHLIGHSGGGFVAGECALQLKKAGFTDLHVTMLDTPVPYASHIKQGWRTDRYASSWYGGRFENDPVSGFLSNRQKIYNAAVSNKLEKVIAVYGNNSLNGVGSDYSYTYVTAGSTPALALGYDVVPGSLGTPDSNYRFVEIVDSGLPANPEDADARHRFAYLWYLKTVTGVVPNNGFAFSNLLGSLPFPSTPSAIPAPPGGPESIPPPDGPEEAPLPPVDLDSFTYFGAASGIGGVQTLTENTDAGFWKAMTMPIGSDTLRFRYRFTSAGDGDFIAAYWGEEVVLVICPDTDSARAGFVEMEADVARFGGQEGNLVFKLLSRGDVNAVAEIDQIQIVLSDDPDGDKLTNAQEAAYGSHAHLYDTDADGLSDYDEVFAHGTDPASADSDSDMVPDLAELAASTDPIDRASYLRPRMERGPGGQPVLLWQGVAGRSYSVVRSLDLTGTAFDFIRTDVPGVGADCSVTDPDTAINPRAFYWVLPE